MKKDGIGRRVVIVQQGGKGNIEQAIFILKKDVENTGEDYILDEARKIVDEFVIRNGMQVRKNGIIWMIPMAFISLAIVCAYLFFKF